MASLAINCAWAVAQCTILSNFNGMQFYYYA